MFYFFLRIFYLISLLIFISIAKGCHDSCSAHLLIVINDLRIFIDDDDDDDNTNNKTQRVYERHVTNGPIYSKKILEYHFKRLQTDRKKTRTELSDKNALNLPKPLFINSETFSVKRCTTFACTK